MKRIVFIAVFLTAIACVFAMGASDEKDSVDVNYTPIGSYPIVEEPITIDIMVSQGIWVEDYDTNGFSLFMEEKTGIKVNWITVPAGVASEKIALTLASGDYPDAFMGFAMTNAQQTTYGAEEGLFLSLTDYYTNVTLPNLEAVMEDTPGAVGFMTLTDGNIYSLPAISSTYHSTNAAKMYVYEPFLDALGMEVPETTDELYAVLLAMKNNDPNGNGKNDEIPLAGAIRGWNQQIERFLLNSFLYCDLDFNTSADSESDVGYMMNGDKIDTAVNKDAFRDGLAYINKLYEEDLLYSGSFTQDHTQVIQLVENGSEPTVGFSAGGWRGQFTDAGGERFENFRAISPLEGPDGVREAINFLFKPTTGVVVLSSETPYAEAILRYFDYLYSMEGTLKSVHGNEGEAWVWAEDGDVNLNGEPAVYKILKASNHHNPQNSTWVSGITSAQTTSYRLGAAVKTEGDYYAVANNDQTLYDETFNLYKPYANPELEVPTIKYTGDETKEFSTIKQELASYIRQTAIKFIIGDLDVEDDDEWNAYIEGLDSLQMDAVLKNMQTAYDRQYK